MRGSLPPLRLVLGAVVTCGFVLTPVALLGGDRSARPHTPTAAQITTAAARQSLAFEPAAGRFGRDVRFVARRGGYALGLMRDGSTVLSSGAARVRTRLIGARVDAPSRPEARLPGIVNSYIGNDRSNWRTGLPTFGSVRYQGVYPGIDLRYHGRQGVLEYDYVLQPGADAGRIAMAISGAARPRLTRAGDLVIRTGSGPLRQRRPVAYQEIGGRRIRVAASFDVDGRRVTFRLGGYDRRHALIIDPQLLFTTYIGATGTDSASSAELVQTNGASYLMVGGKTRSIAFHGSNQNATPDLASDDAWISKLSADGTTILATTFIGGTGQDTMSGITSGGGRVFVTGSTTGGLPVDAGLITPFDNHYDSGDSWIGRLTPADLSIEVLTYFPGTSTAGIAYTNFSVVVGGTETTAGLATTGAYDETLGGFSDAWAGEFNSSLTQRKWATYVGSATAEDDGLGVAVDDDSSVYLVGYTVAATDFPVTVGSGAATDLDGFVAKLPSTGAGPLSFSRLYGGSGTDVIDAIAVQSPTLATVGGWSNSGTLPGIAGPNTPSGINGFFSRLSTNSSTTFGGGFFGGTGDNEAITRVAIDGYGEVYLAGDTNSTNFPTTNPVQSQNAGGQDAFLVKVFGGTTAFSTYLGGSGNDTLGDLVVAPGTIDEAHQPATGRAYLVGATGSNNLGATALYAENAPTPVQPAAGGAGDAFVARVEPRSAKITGGPAEGSTVANSTGSFTLGPAPETGGSFACSIDGGAFGACGTSPSFPGLSDGEHTLGARYHDPAGLSNGTAATRTWIVDVTPPLSFAQQTPAEAAIVSSKPTFTWDTTSDALSEPVSYELWIDGARRDEPPVCGNGSCTVTLSTPLAGGAHTWAAHAIDAVGNVQPNTSRNLTVDTIGPSSPALTGPADGAELPGAKPTFSWSAATDAGIGLAEYEVELDGRPLASHLGTWTLSFTPSDALAEGTHNWRVIASDQFGNGTSSEIHKFRVDLTPPSAQLTASPNPMLAGRTVTLDASASSDAAGGTIVRYEWDLDGDGSFEVDGGSTPTITKSFNASGSYLMGVRVTDTVGQTRSAATTLIVTTPPIPPGQLGVTINNGAQYTKSADVTLFVNFLSSTTQLLVSNDGGFLAPATFNPQKQVSWKLDSSGPERLPKTVYVRFLLNGIVSETYTDDIILDEIPPVVQTATVAPAAPGTAARAAALKSFVVKVKATDSNSGVDAVQITAKKSNPGRFLKYKTKLTVKAATKKLYVRARDRAGNLSAWKKAR